MKRWFLFSLLFLLILAGVVAATFPAAVAYRWWGAQAPDITMQGINGTLWSGEAARFSARGQALGRVTWQISPWTLFRGIFESHLAVDGPGLKLSARVSRLADGGIALEGLSGEAEAKWLAPVLAIPLEPSGMLTVDGASLRLDAQRLPRAVDAKIVWREAGVRGLVQARFGTITIDSHGSDGRITTTIADAGDGDLEVRGKVDLVEINYKSEMTLRSRVPDGPVVEALKWIGEERPDGGRLLLIEGHLLLPAPAP
jgi:hypothetical protein